jgi:hypothetical protein
MKEIKKKEKNIEIIKINGENLKENVNVTKID